MSASSPGPDDKSGITDIVLRSGVRLHVQRTVNTITVFDLEWDELFSQTNFGQPDTAVAQAADAYQAGWARGEEAGREGFRWGLLRMLGAQPVKEEG